MFQVVRLDVRKGIRTNLELTRVKLFTNKAIPILIQDKFITVLISPMFALLKIGVKEGIDEKNVEC
ncbi:hypothetical protein A8F94_15565 [Bacillus sp. FJAT-27225]|nr:hypothetical protein A8F94_15565 [Bacillus sp. FJAT-27225]